MKERKPEIAEKEYMMLREEIMNNIQRREDRGKFAYTVTFAVFTAALHFGNSLLVILNLFFLFSMSIRVAQSGYSISFLASYMTEFLEKETGFRWETYSHVYEKMFPKTGINRILKYGVRWDFLALSIMSCVLFWLMQEFDVYIYGYLSIGMLIIVLQVFIIVAEMYITAFYSKKVSKLKKVMLDNWSIVEKALTKKQKKNKSKQVRVKLSNNSSNT